MLVAAADGRPAEASRRDDRLPCSLLATPMAEAAAGDTFQKPSAQCLRRRHGRTGGRSASEGHHCSALPARPLLTRAESAALFQRWTGHLVGGRADSHATRWRRVLSGRAFAAAAMIRTRPTKFRSEAKWGGQDRSGEPPPPSRHGEAEGGLVRHAPCPRTSGAEGACGTGRVPAGSQTSPERRWPGSQRQTTASVAHATLLAATGPEALRLKRSLILRRRATTLFMADAAR